MPGKLYVNIAETMRQRIDSGEWQPGAQIPTINTLAKEFDVAVVTIRQAVEMLEQDGMLKRRQGKGTFVEPNARPDQIWLQMDSTWFGLERVHKGFDPKILNAVDNMSQPPLHEGDGFPVSAYHYMRRLHRVDGTPYALVDIYLDMEIYSRSPDRFDSERVVENIKAQPDITIKSAKESLTVGEANAEVAQLLNVRLYAPVALVRRVVKDQRGRVVFLAECVYRGDIVNLERSFVG